MKKLLLLIFLLLLVPIVYSEEALVILNQGASLKDTITLIESNGGKATHRFPPDAIIGDIPNKASTNLMKGELIASINYNSINRETLSSRGKTTELIADVWNNKVDQRGKPEKPALEGISWGDPRFGREVILKNQFKETISSSEPLFNNPFLLPGSGYYKTSEYLIGSVSVGIFLMESNGKIDSNIEDWTPAEEANVISEIYTGLNWMASQEPKAGVSWTYDIHYKSPTSYEPITRPAKGSNGHFLWVDETFLNLGYLVAGTWDKVYDYLNDLRTNQGTDWAYAIFVADDTNDADKRFADGYTAFAYNRGPFLIMNYGNGGWNIENMDKVTAHESHHIFGASDEYCSPGYSCCSCTDADNYLGIPNSYCEAGCEGNNDCGPSQNNDGSCGCSACYTSDCIMDADAWCQTPSTRAQLGWVDDDNDNSFAPVDCNENNANIKPGAAEVKCDGIDQDCSGSDNTGTDLDNDGYKTEGGLCGAVDCNDNDNSVYPGAAEICDGKNNDCNAATADGSGETAPLNSKQAGVCSGSRKSCTSGSWVDNYANVVNYQAEETSCDSKDNDCDSQTDEFLKTTYYRDLDSDNYGVSTVFQYVCTQPAGYVTVSGDCNDNNYWIHPGVADVCDNIDNDCNAATADGSGETAPLNSKQAGVCSGSRKYCPGGEWIDNYNSISGYEMFETTCDNKDNDCDGFVNDNLIHTGPLNPKQIGICSGSKKSCDAAHTSWFEDYSGIAYYEPTEITCDTKDNDCDNAVDENLKTTYYQDLDADNYGNNAVTQQACAKPSGYAAISGDCNDNDNTIKPGAAEICDGKDNDCTSLTADGSGELAPLNSKQAGVCSGSKKICSGSWVDNYNVISNYESTEASCDNLDNDCDNSIDENLKTTYYQDSDSDNYGNNAAAQQACAKPEGYVTANNDCNDNNNAVNPGAAELCNKQDDNCDGILPDNEKDLDGDGKTACEGDNCPNMYNPNQIDTDKDGKGDVCDKGDINNDGSVDVFDVQASINQALGLATATPEADVNADSTVDIFDVQKIINIALGLEKNGKVCVSGKCTACTSANCNTQQMLNILNGKSSGEICLGTCVKCTSGKCKPIITCSSNTQCGTNGWIGTASCSNNGDVYQNYITYTCSNPGKASASCTNKITRKLKQDCNSAQVCQNGQCKAKTSKSQTINRR